MTRSSFYSRLQSTSKYHLDCILIKKNSNANRYCFLKEGTVDNGSVTFQALYKKAYIRHDGHCNSGGENATLLVL
jgi:hypothetical protein